MSPEERRRPLGKWVALGVVLGFVVFAALSIASGVWQWFPKEPPKFLVNPAVILPLWLVCVWFAYRGWRVAEGQGETAVMEGDSGQPPVLSPVGTVATWEMIVAVLLITVAMILIFWVGIGLVSGPINH